MKKLISAILIVLMIFNFICCSNTISLASDPDMPEKGSPFTNTNEAPISNTATVSIITDGTVSSTQGKAADVTLNALSIGTSGIGMILGLLARLFNVLIFINVDVILGLLTNSKEGTNDYFWFTIDRCVFNRIPLFNINYFNTDATYKVGKDLTLDANPSNVLIKEGITDIYYICRVLALVLSLLVLIYIGIRMALSTVASDQAKYKKMLISWVESIVILFLLIYITSAIITFGELLTGLFYDIEQQLITNASSETEKEVFEETIRYDAIQKNVFDMSGMELALYAIIYWALLLLEIKYFWLYAKRLLMVGLLITISPLITITYSIDKIGDGKSQVFSTWMKEFTVNVLIQPLHALIYMVFVLTANNIAAQSPLLALALLWSMGAVERMVKVIFDMKGLVSLRGLDKLLKKQ